MGNAWVEYELPAAAEVSEVMLKRARWRQLAYPVRVTVDRKKVYRG